MTGYTAVLLIVGVMPLLLSESYGAASRNGLIASGARSDVNSVLGEMMDFIASNRRETVIPAMVRRQVGPQSNDSNMTDYCSGPYVSLLLQELNETCINSLSSLSVANPIYSTSVQGRGDINNVCREDCAGVLLEFNDTCPHYFPDFSGYLRGICSINVVHRERCGFSVAENDGSRVFQKCFVETDAFTRCRSRCKNALINFSADLGCCINTFYNDTYSFFRNLQVALPELNYTTDPLLWDTCGVPYPAECPPDLFTFPSPTPTPSSAMPTPSSPSSLLPSPNVCTESEATLTTFSERCLVLLKEFQTPTGLRNIAANTGNMKELCSADCAGNYFMYCNNKAGGDNYAITLEFFCGQYNKEFCGGVIADSYSMLLQNLSACDNTQHDYSTYNCTTKCRSALVDVNLELGCCAHALTLGSVSVHAGTDHLDSHLWTLCDFQPPQACPNPFQSVLEESQETTTANKGRSCHLYIVLYAGHSVVWLVRCQLHG